MGAALGSGTTGALKGVGSVVVSRLKRWRRQMAEIEAGKFNIDVAQKGYSLNRMCHSLNQAENRAAFTADEESYCARYGLNDEERAAVRSRDRQLLFAAGGNKYFLAKP